MSLPLALLLALSSQSVGDGSVIGEASITFELVEEGLQVEENWQLQNQSDAEIPAEGLVLRIDRTAKGVRLPPKSDGVEVSEADSAVRADRPLGPKQGRTFSFRYLVPVGGSKYEFHRLIDFGLVAAHVGFVDTPGLSISSSRPLSKRVRDFGGVRWMVWDMGAVPAGSTLEFQALGLPNAGWGPRPVALAAGALILAWAIWAFRSQRAPGARARRTSGPDTAAARRERLLAALEILERDRKRERLDAAQHERRQRALLEELAVVLREAELEEKALGR
ncbi:MAG: hypothetical protein U1E65_14595 [Myxococcota bacterium]